MRVLKTVHTITLDKIKTDNSPYFVERFKKNDGSVTIYVYDKQRAVIEFEKSKTNSYWRNPYGVFELNPVITERKLLLSILIKRPTAHKYQIAVSNEIGTEFVTVATYNDINEFIKPYITNK